MPEEKYCVVCGSKIKNSRNKMFCSYKCAGLHRQNYAVCPVCGNTFKHSPSDTTTHTCGRTECKKEWRRRNTAPEQIKPAHDAIKTSPKTGHFDTHHAAKEWKLISPDGKLYEFKNLGLWAEENADLLPTSRRTGKRVLPKTFAREILRLKSNFEKYTYFCDNYYQWRIYLDD